MSFAIVSLILLAIIALIVIPILIRVVGAASRQDPDNSDDKERNRDDQPGRSGRGR